MTTDHEVTRLQLDQYRAELERIRVELERHNSALESWRPGFEALIRFADITIRSLLLLNGGSALALLSFAGNAASHGDRVRFMPSLTAFGVGAALSVLTAGLAYLTQVAYVEYDQGRLAVWLRAVAIACAFVALGAFCAGTWAAAVSLA